MLGLRRQLPVHSPLPLRSVAAGVAALTGRTAASERRVSAWLTSRWGPVDHLRTDSGTSALALALAAAGRATGGAPVALPAYCCYDVVTAAVGADVPVVFYDLDPGTLGPDPASLRAALDDGAGTVVVAHLYGLPVDLDRVRELTGAAGALLIEDAAQAAGGRWDDRPLGSFGSVSVLSFGRGKGVTGAGGGALLAHDERGARMVADARRHVRDRAAGWREGIVALGMWGIARPPVYAVPAALPFLGLGETEYRDPRPPGRQSRFSTGMLSVTLGVEADEVRGRVARAERLLEALEGGRGLVPVRPPSRGRPGYLRLPVLARGTDRESLLGPRARRLGVMPGYPKPLPELPAIGPLRTDGARDVPGAWTLARDLLTLPVHGLVTPGDEARLRSWVSGHRDDVLQPSLREATGDVGQAPDASV